MNASEIRMMIFTYLFTTLSYKDGKGTRLPLVTFESPAEGRRCLPKGKTPVPLHVQVQTEMPVSAGTHCWTS